MSLLPLALDSSDTRGWDFRPARSAHQGSPLVVLSGYDVAKFGKTSPKTHRAHQTPEPRAIGMAERPYLLWVVLSTRVRGLRDGRQSSTSRRQPRLVKSKTCRVRTNRSMLKLVPGQSVCRDRGPTGFASTVAVRHLATID